MSPTFMDSAVRLIAPRSGGGTPGWIISGGMGLGFDFLDGGEG